MRTIKFRGIVNGYGKMNGETVYGDYITPWADDQTTPMIREYIFDHKDEDGHITASLTNYKVIPESIAQLVGTDKNGVEIYEGDDVCNPVDGTVFKAAMNHIYTIKRYELLARKEKF